MDTTVFLRFPDEATFRSLLPADFEQLGETGSPLPDGVTAISIIGPRESGGVWDALGNVITPPTIDARWHANVPIDSVLPASWVQYRIYPTTPDRVFG